MDSKLLVDWLDKAVPVDVILTAIEEVAARRSKARIKRPLSLNAVKSVVKKGLKSNSVSSDTDGLTRLIQRLEQTKSDELVEVSQQFQVLQTRGLPAQELLAEVLEVARKFHEHAWKSCDQDALLAEAKSELGGLQAMLSAERFKTALEEVARDNLRKRYKLLSATHLSQVFRS